MFGFKFADRPLSDAQIDRLNAACEALGVRPPRFRKDTAQFDLGRGSISFGAARLIPLFSDEAIRSPVLTVVRLASLLEVMPPADALGDLPSLKPLFRPRLMHPRELSGPRRAFCRREAFGDLLAGVAIGSEPGAPLVTTALLDHWGLTFEGIFAASCANMARRVSSNDLLEVQGATGLLALVHDEEESSGAVFILDRLFPKDLLPDGVVVCVPSPEVMLAHPVIRGSGPDGLAAIVQAGYSMASERERPLSEHTIWWREERFEVLPMTTVKDRRSRRIHLEARGPLEDLLRILGAIE